MRIAIAGAGIAGGYLARLLGRQGMMADLYDGLTHNTRCGFRSCGWGVPVGIEIYLDKIGLDLNEYLLEKMPVMHFDGLKAKTPLCTIDKPRLLQDLIKGSRLYGKSPALPELKDYDIIVDATGISRALLPPCKSDLILPTMQQRVFLESRGRDRLDPGVYGNIVPGLGYLWIFPIGNDQYHIGAGGIGLVDHNSIISQFCHEVSGRCSLTTLCRCKGFVRVASPYYSTPFSFRKPIKGGKTQVIVGIGESIGTVSPFTGEGIIFSLECAKMLADAWPDYQRYTDSVLSGFAWMKKERETLDYLLAQKGKNGPRLRDRWRFYRSARRSGIGLPMLDAFKRIGTLSRWVEYQNGEN